jgi:putative flippase GtrA
MLNFKYIFDYSAEAIRFCQAGVLNFAFGFGLYVLLVKLGFTPYISQLISHMIGIIFNYTMYHRYVFIKSKPAKFKFLISYIVNYLLSLMILYILMKVIISPYLSGFITILLVFILNYFMLKNIIFLNAPK